MKAITLWQPWASAVAYGSKQIETRSWSTKYRGPLLIHAAKRCIKYELIHLSCCWNWKGALCQEVKPWPLGLPFGALIAKCNLIDCRPTGEFTQNELDTLRVPPIKHGELYAWSERQLGDFSLGRFGWVLTDIKKFKKPISYKGSQGFFDVPENISEALIG